MHQGASPARLIGSRPALAQGWGRAVKGADSTSKHRTEGIMRSRRKLGLAGRAGRWSAGHRKTAIWGWIAFVVAALVIGSALGTKTLDNGGGDGQAARAAK